MQDCSYDVVCDYQKFDEIVNKMFINIYSINKNCNDIVVRNFDPKSDNCMLYFEVASLVANVFNKDLKIECSLFRYLWFKLKNRKRSFTRAKGNVSQRPHWTTMLDWMAEQLDLTDKDYSNIYHAYYKKGNK